MKKILCKCDYDFFTQGQYYEYEKNNNVNIRAEYAIYNYSENHTCYTDIEDIQMYFYTDNQIRKFKLYKINESR